jgi:hypothetical protein
MRELCAAVNCSKKSSNLNDSPFFRFIKREIEEREWEETWVDNFGQTRQRNTKALFKNGNMTRVKGHRKYQSISDSIIGFNFNSIDRILIAEKVMFRMS